MNNIVSILSKIMIQDREKSVDMIEQILVEESYKDNLKESLETFFIKNSVVDQKEKRASESLRSIVTKYR